MLIIAMAAEPLGLGDELVGSNETLITKSRTL